VSVLLFMFVKVWRWYR